MEISVKNEKKMLGKEHNS